MNWYNALNEDKKGYRATYMYPKVHINTKTYHKIPVKTEQQT